MRCPLGAGSRIVAVLLLVLVTGCGGAHPTVAGKLRSIAGRGVGTMVRIADLTDFTWSRFVWVEPYTMRQQVDAALGFAWPEYDKIGLEQSDGFSLLVFADNGRVVRFEEQRRGQGEFVQEVSAHAFGRKDAVFRVVDWQQVFLYAPVKAGA